jgi:hypothetical protein
LTGSSAAKSSTCKIDAGRLTIGSLTEVCHVTQKVMTNGIASSSIPKDFVPYLVDAPPLTATLVVSGTEKDWFIPWKDTYVKDKKNLSGDLVQLFVQSEAIGLFPPKAQIDWSTTWPLGKGDLEITQTSGICRIFASFGKIGFYPSTNQFVDIRNPCTWSVTSKSRWLDQPVATMRLIPRNAIVTVTAPVSNISVGSSVQLTSTVRVTDDRLPFPPSSPSWTTYAAACTVSASGVVTGKAPGKCEVYAEYESAIYNLVGTPIAIEIVPLLPQTVTWKPDTSPGLTFSAQGGKQFTASQAATSTGPGSITYSVSSPGKTFCRISSQSPLTIIVGADGTCSVSATAAATSAHAAGSTTVEFTISGFDTPATVSGGGGGGTGNDDRGTYDCPAGTRAVWNGSRWYCDLA